jgi:PAS domain S-box-containing protein
VKRKLDGIERRQSARVSAERMVSSLAPPPNSTRPAEVLLHELLVNKVEFEAQIDELKRTHAELETARDRFEDLYNRSPVGYITISRECLIREINLTAAALLGADRRKLVNRRFSKIVSPGDRDRWDRRFIGLVEDSGAERKSFVLELMRADASTFSVYVDCQRRDAGDSAPTLRLALVDISNIREAEEERRSAVGATKPR